MVKKLTNLLRNKNPITVREFVGFLRKTSDRKYASLRVCVRVSVCVCVCVADRNQTIREPTILSDKIVSLLPQLTFEDERSRAKERHEQQRKDRYKGGKAAKPAVKRKESAEERERKAKELAIKEDEDERRKFTIVLASLGKMRKIEGMLYVYGMLKARQENEEEQIRQSLDEATARYALVLVCNLLLWPYARVITQEFSLAFCAMAQRWEGARGGGSMEGGYLHVQPDARRPRQGRLHGQDPGAPAGDGATSRRKGSDHLQRAVQRLLEARRRCQG
jgi:hypothetical protein